MLDSFLTTEKKIYRYLALDSADKTALQQIAAWDDRNIAQKLPTMMAGCSKDDRLLWLLKNAVLYCPLPTQFNDPHDCLVTFAAELWDKNRLPTFRRLHSTGMGETAAQACLCESITQERFHALLVDTNLDVALTTEERDAIDEACRAEIQRRVNLSRLVCFSKRSQSTLLWAHYADKHHGFCLEFDVPTLRKRLLGFYEVTYSESRPGLSLSDEELGSLGFAKKVLLTKAKDWDYEAEVRHVNGISLSDESGAEYMRFDRKALTAVIMGTKMDKYCKTGLERLVSNLEGYEHTKIRYATINRQEFKIDIA